MIIQGNELNNSRLATVVCVVLSGNLDRAGAPGNVLLPAELTGLPRDSVAIVSQIVTVDRRVLIKRVGKLTRSELEFVFFGIDFICER